MPKRKAEEEELVENSWSQYILGAAFDSDDQSMKIILMKQKKLMQWKRKNIMQRYFDSDLEWDPFIKQNGEEVKQSTARDWRTAFFNENPRLPVDAHLIEP